MKAPRPFSKAYTSEQLRKKILKKLNIETDRKFVASLFTKDSKTGKYQITADIDKKTKARLKVLARAIKANKGLFVLWKLALITLLAVAIIVFNLLFKNMIIERIAERALETVFSAKTDISGLNASLLKGNFTFNTLTIGDRDHPMKNLVDTGPAAFRIDTARLLKKRFFIKELSLTEVQTGTERTESAAIIRRKKEKEEGKGFDLPTLPSLSFNLDDYDFRSLVENEKENLSVYPALQALDTEAAGMKTEWEKRLNDTQKNVDNAGTAARRLKETQISNINDITRLRSFIGDLDSAIKDVQELNSSLAGIKSGISADQRTIRNKRAAIQQGIAQDYSHLRGLVNIPSAGRMSVASDMATAIVGPQFRTWHSHVLRGLDIYQRVRDLRGNPSQKEPDRETAAHRYQQFIVYPLQEYPNILLGKAELDFIGQVSGRGLIENLTDNPDLPGKPAHVSAGVRTENGAGSLDAVLDGRTGKESLSLKVSVENRPVTLHDGLESVGIDALSGNLSGTISLNLVKDYSEGQGKISLVLAGASVRQKAGSGLLHDAVKNIFSSPRNIQISGNFTIENNSIDKISISSNIDDLLSRQAGDYIRGQVSQIEQKLRRELAAYTGDIVTEYAYLDSFLNEEDTKALAQIRSVDEAKKQLDEKKKEARDKINALTNEVQGKVEEQAGKLKDKIKLPGF